MWFYTGDLNKRNPHVGYADPGTYNFAIVATPTSGAAVTSTLKVTVVVIPD
jgi:hypothetical protein